MLNGFRTRSLALLLVGLMAWPAAARVYVECADGTACSALPAAGKPADCCSPDPCDHPPAAPADESCVVRAGAEPVFVPPAAAVDLTDLPPLAILPFKSITADPDRSFVVVPVREERPPAFPAPGQGRSPRSPPPAHA